MGENVGEISGWVEVDMYFKERSDYFYSKLPQPILDRPASDFQIELTQLHFARLRKLISDVKELSNAYQSITNWEDPHISFICFIIYFYSCLSSGMEYNCIS